ncbi:MAG: polysaccharide biosynthesis protein [Bacteroidales bacterium]|nr:polysaccharide biosynthesis protein [Bacteroidales bacterium]
MLRSLVQRLNKSYLSRTLIVTMDLILSVLASILVLFAADIIFGHYQISPVGEPRQKFAYVLLAAVASAIAFLVFRPYRIIIRRLSAKDLTVFASASLLKGVLLFGVILAAQQYSGTALLLTSFDVFVTAAALVFVRILMIRVWEHFNSRIQEKYEHKRVIVYGTSDKSVATIMRLQNSPHYKVIGFLDSQAEGRKIEGLPVFCPKDEGAVEKTLIDNRIDAILFPTEKEAQDEEDRLIHFCSLKGIKCLIIPMVDEVVEGEAILRPREIKVEDLLGRDEIHVSLDAISSHLQGKTVLVTGAAGSIGSELCRQIAGFGVGKLILFDNAETPMHNLRLELEERFPQLRFVPIIGDVRHPERLDFAFRTHRPQIVFHAAAYKHVPLMEENPCEAVLVNVYGTQNVASKCLEYGAESMVMISTDKAVNPTNIMGCTKRLAEIYVQSLGLATAAAEAAGDGKQDSIPSGNASLHPQPLQPATRFVTTRFGNVLGSNGSVIPRFKEQIAKGGPVTVTHPEINRFFMTIPEACRLVMEAATMGEGNQIFVFDMGTPVKIDDLARRMIRLAGFEPDQDIRIEYTGLRPGEKLYEEVLANEENTLPSFHPRIRVAKVRSYAFADVEDMLHRMIQLARDVDIPAMVELMKETVPEYNCTTDFGRRS